METPQLGKINWYIVGGVAVVGYLVYKYFFSSNPVSNPATPSDPTVGGLGGNGSSGGGSGSGGDTTTYPQGTQPSNVVTPQNQSALVFDSQVTTPAGNTYQMSSSRGVDYSLPSNIAKSISGLPNEVNTRYGETQTLVKDASQVLGASKNAVQTFTPYASKFTLSNALSTLPVAIKTASGQSQSLNTSGAVLVSQSQRASQVFVPYSNSSTNYANTRADALTKAGLSGAI